MPTSAVSANQAMLPAAVRQHEKCGQQRADCRADVSADLKERLRQPVASAGREARNPRRLGMEHGGARAR